MTPERAATVFRELLQTPDGELGWFAGRAGLTTSPDHEDLMKARELLQSLALALASGPGVNWQRVQAAWTGMRQGHGALDMSAPAKGRPKWVRDLPPKPSLGDAARGIEADQAPQASRFIPVVQPPAQQVPPPLVGPAVASPGAPPRARPPGGPPPVPKRGSGAVAPATHNAEVAVVEMTLARYAAFCAACSNNPGGVAVVEAEYGIHNPTQRAALDDHWQDQFDEDPAALAQWEKLCGQFRQALGSKR